MDKIAGPLETLYAEYQGVFDYARSEWEATRSTEGGRKENYWQGKKDGIRAAMNLLWPLVLKERKESSKLV
jgi:hypothetical protein